MKLLYCPNCQDIFNLAVHNKECSCGATKGHYCEDGFHAIYTSPGVPLGLLNSEFVRALKEQPAIGLGVTFTAFVIPKKCPTFIKE